ARAPWTGGGSLLGYRNTCPRDDRRREHRTDPAARRGHRLGVPIGNRGGVAVPARVLLGVNVDHVATVRQARRTTYPDPVEAARFAERAGADGITAHLREDRRHINDHDIERLRATVATKLNLEMAATAEMCGKALEIRPQDVCIVP